MGGIYGTFESILLGRTLSASCMIGPPFPAQTMRHQKQDSKVNLVRVKNTQECTVTHSPCWPNHATEDHVIKVHAG